MKITNHPSTPQAIVLRCRVVLGAAKGIANNELARQLSTSLPTVLLWRRRFQQQGWLAILELKVFDAVRLQVIRLPDALDGGGAHSLGPGHATRAPVGGIVGLGVSGGLNNRGFLFWSERAGTSRAMLVLERQTHDYERHGTTTLFAALIVLEGTVIGHCQPRDRLPRSPHQK